MEKLKIKIEFDCLANKEETEEQLNSIINYQIYERIWNVSEDNGFFNEDIKEIKDLSVGQKHDIHGILESMSVYRYN